MNPKDIVPVNVIRSKLKIGVKDRTFALLEGVYIHTNIP